MGVATRARRLLAVALAAGMAWPAAAEELRMMTGPQGGAWLPLGAALKTVWERAIPGLTIQTLPGAGIANIRAIQKGEAEIGFGNAISTLDAIAGRDVFKQPHDKVCNLATLYPQYLQIVVAAESPIATLADLKGTVLTTQVRGNTGEITTRMLLKSAGLTRDDIKIVYGTYGESVAMMKDGSAAAFSLGTTVPGGPVVELAKARDIRLLDLSGSIEAMRKLNSGFVPVTIKAGTYPKQARDVQVIGYAAHVAVSCALPDDRAYGLAKAILGGLKDVAVAAPAMAGLDAKTMAGDIGVPMHPGAARFYREANPR